MKKFIWLFILCVLVACGKSKAQEIPTSESESLQTPQVAQIVTSESESLQTSQVTQVVTSELESLQTPQTTQVVSSPVSQSEAQKNTSPIYELILVDSHEDADRAVTWSTDSQYIFFYRGDEFFKYDVLTGINIATTLMDKDFPQEHTLDAISPFTQVYSSPSGNRHITLENISVVETIDPKIEGGEGGVSLRNYKIEWVQNDQMSNSAEITGCALHSEELYWDSTEEFVILTELGPPYFCSDMEVFAWLISTSTFDIIPLLSLNDFAPIFVHGFRPNTKDILFEGPGEKPIYLFNTTNFDITPLNIPDGLILGWLDSQTILLREFVMTSPNSSYVNNLSLVHIETQEQIYLVEEESIVTQHFSLSPDRKRFAFAIQPDLDRDFYELWVVNFQ